MSRKLQKPGRYQIKRKSRKRSEIKKQDAFQYEEGKQYQSGAFH